MIILQNVELSIVLNNYSHALEDEFRGLEEQSIDRKERTGV